MNVDWGTFQFGSPWVLIALPLVALALWWLGRQRATPGMLISSIALVRTISRPVRARTGWMRDALRAVAVALLVLALAEPRTERAAAPEDSRAIDIMLLVDASRSMETEDFETRDGKVSRIKALRDVVDGFVKSRPQDRIGVIGFAEKPFLLCPLTLDHGWMMDALLNMETSLGTAIGSSIEAGVDLLRAGGNESRVMILITDGLNTSGTDPMQAAKIAQMAGIRLHTIAAVSYDAVITDNFEAHPLYQLSKLTGGRFFQAGNAQSLQLVYDEIDQLERQRLRQMRSRHFAPLVAPIAALAGLIVSLELALRATRWLRIP
jgi:Ca-activated chloride channel homolog